MCSPYQYDLTIADVPIRLETRLQLPPNQAFAPFLVPGREPRYRVIFREREKLPEIPEQILYTGVCERVHPDGRGGYLRSFFDGAHDGPVYGVGTYDYPAGRITVDYLPEGREFVSCLDNSFFHVGWEGLLRQEGKFCLHAACIRTKFGALLFSGPSGRGKSTQAALWQRYRGGTLLNGDRPILGMDGGVLRAWGSPYAGSSRCYVNESSPVGAVILLESWGACKARRLPVAQAFRGIYGGLTQYSWDPSFTAGAFDFAVAAAQAVPVYAYSCTAGEESVRYLEKILESDLCP